MTSYEILLKNEKQKQYTWICIFIIIINFLIFTYLVIAPPTTLVQTAAIGGCVAIIIFMAIEYFLVKNKHAYQSLYKYLALTSIAGAWFSMGNYWAAGIVAVIDMLFVLTQRELMVRVNSSAIRYPAFPAKTFNWANLNNIILRDGLLTIDCKNNSLIQQYIDDKRTSISEQEFNEFCRKQLEK